MSGPDSTAAEPKPRSTAWRTALTTVQEVEPPFIPAGAHAMTVVIEYPPGDPGAPPHRHPGPAFGYVLEGEMLMELEGQAPRPVPAGEAFGEDGSGDRRDRGEPADPGELGGPPVDRAVDERAVEAYDAEAVRDAELAGPGQHAHPERREQQSAPRPKGHVGHVTARCARSPP